jgi:hypothetical protein
MAQASQKFGCRRVNVLIKEKLHAGVEIWISSAATTSIAYSMHA